MATKLKITPALEAEVGDALEQYTQRLYDDPGLHLMAIVEFTHDTHVVPGPDSAKSPVVNVKIAGVEIGRGEQERHLREAARVLFAQRTARGTLDEADQLELSDQTTDHLAGLVAAEEVARLRATIKAYADELADVGGRRAHSLDEVYNLVNSMSERLERLTRDPIAADD